MSDFKAKIHQIRFTLELRPRPRLGAYSAPQTSSLQHSPDPLAVFKGPTSKGREGERMGREERVGEGKGE